MMLRQYNVGKWFGAYYTELNNSLGMVSLGNALVGLTVLWAVAPQAIAHWFPWLSYPLFIAIVLFSVLVVFPIAHYMFMYKSIAWFQSEQSYKHRNPIKADMDEMRGRLTKIGDRLTKIEGALGIADGSEPGDADGEDSG